MMKIFFFALTALIIIGLSPVCVASSPSGPMAPELQHPQPPPKPKAPHKAPKPKEPPKPKKPPAPKQAKKPKAPPKPPWVK